MVQFCRKLKFNFRRFKITFGFEDCLTKILKDLREAFVKFRTTNNILPIVTGRFCTICNKIVLEMRFTIY